MLGLVSCPGRIDGVLCARRCDAGFRSELVGWLDWITLMGCQVHNWTLGECRLDVGFGTVPRWMGWQARDMRHLRYPILEVLEILAPSVRHSRVPEGPDVIGRESALLRCYWLELSACFDAFAS